MRFRDKRLYREAFLGLKMGFSDRLKDVLKGLTVDDFAKRIGVAKSTAQRYLAGHLPKGDNLERIAIEFDVSVDWLLTGEGDSLRRKNERIRYMRSSAASHVSDEAGLFGRTEYKELEGKRVAVTMFEPDDRDAGPVGLGQAVEMLASILGSGDPIFTQAILSNLRAFYQAVDDRKRITKLETDCEFLRKEVEVLKQRLDAGCSAEASKESSAT